MSADLSRWPQADAILDEALALPPAERAAYVTRAAGNDTELRAALAAVIAESMSHDGFLPPGGAMAGELGASLAAPDDDLPRLAAGSRVEHYEVGALIGRGGMGEVYRAVDTRLHRDVALKVLPDRFARDADRLARFRREARVLATLSDPGIAAIYGVAEGVGVEALVLELVEGPTLAERLTAGPLTLNEVFAVARALVDAVAAAHARGILHRDLKPANVKLLPGGGVKVLDFGLAKALSGDAAPAALGPTDLSGVGPARLLGTLAYMSPEQLRGETLDARADIWSFGCVLFEMLTGTRAFAGDAPADVIARILEREPAFGLLPAGTPAALRRLLRHTLEKDPRRRLAHIDDARLDVDDAVIEPVLASPSAAGTAWRWWAAAVVGALGVGAAAGSALLPGDAPVTPAVRFEVTLPEGDRPPLTYQPVVALSPDGATLVYRAERDGVVRLFRRGLDELVPTPLPGTEGATSPFFSPDGQWLGFDSGGLLKRTPSGGGSVITIGAAPGTATATWMADGSIVFATNTRRELQRIPAGGGDATTLTTLDTGRGDTMHLLPQALPDGRTVLYTVLSGAARRVAAVRVDTGERREIAPGTHGRYVPSGHLMLLRDGTLWSLPFDAASLTATGPGAAVVDDVAQTDGAVGHYDVAPGGALVYLPRQPETDVRQLVWFDREGRQERFDTEARNYSRVSLAANGTRIAATIEQDGNTDVWVGDPSRAMFSRLTLDPTIDTMPTLTPDGAFVAFRSEREGPGVFRRDAQGAGAVERLTTTSGPIHSPYSWTPDGRTLLLAIFRGFKSQAIARVTPPSTDVEVLLDGDFAQLDPQVSPDGRWLAYQSDETGQFEIYVRPYPDVGSGRWQVSRRGGMSPRWHPGGRELFFFDGEGLNAAAVAAGRHFTTGVPRRLFAVAPARGSLGTDYEVSPDGGRFLFIVPVTDRLLPRASLVWMLNWQRDLERRAAGAR